MILAGVGLLRACCCCCPNGDGRAPTRVATSGITIPPFTPEESETLEKAGRRFMQETGRKCADFFPTMRDTSNADHLLADVETFLIKLKGITDEELAAATNTFCFIFPPPGPGIEPPPRRKPPPPPPAVGCPFIVRSRFGPQAVRSTRGLGCHDTEQAARVGLRIFLRNNPGLSGRIEAEGDRLIQEETTKI